MFRPDGYSPYLSMLVIYERYLEYEGPQTYLNRASKRWQKNYYRSKYIAKSLFNIPKLLLNTKATLPSIYCSVCNLCMLLYFILKLFAFKKWQSTKRKNIKMFHQKYLFWGAKKRTKVASSNERGSVTV